MSSPGLDPFVSDSNEHKRSSVIPFFKKAKMEEHVHHLRFKERIRYEAKSKSPEHLLTSLQAFHMDMVYDDRKQGQYIARA